MQGKLRAGRMTHAADNNPQAQQVARWLYQHVRLEQLIEENRDDPRCVYWQRRLHMIRYLLQRYADEVSVADVLRLSPPTNSNRGDELEEPLEPTAPAVTDTTFELRHLGPTRAAGPEAGVLADVPVRVGTNFRATLERVRQLNQPRYLTMDFDEQQAEDLAFEAIIEDEPEDMIARLEYRSPRYVPFAERYKYERLEMVAQALKRCDRWTVPDAQGQQPRTQGLPSNHGRVETRPSLRPPRGLPSTETTWAITIGGCWH